jgi:hypothetical protein
VIVGIEAVPQGVRARIPGKGGAGRTRVRASYPAIFPDHAREAAGAGDSLAQMVAVVIEALGDPACLAASGRSSERVTRVEALERSLFGREVFSGSHGASVVDVE